MYFRLAIRFRLRAFKGANSQAQYSVTRQLSMPYLTHCSRRLNVCLCSSHLQLLAKTGEHLYISRSLSTHKLTCWKCGAQNEGADLVCSECNVLQKPNTKLSYFDILGIEQKYDINLATLTRKFYQLQNVLHPDRFSNKPEEERKISEDYSSLINKAYFTLLSPLSRGLYLLELNDIFIEEGKIQMPSEFLMEIMERNEEVDQARGAPQLRELAEKNKIQLEKLNQEASKAFNTGNIQEAEQVLINMKYYSSIDSKIKEAKQKYNLED